LASLLLLLWVQSGCRMYSAREDFELHAPWGDYQRFVVRTRNGSVELTRAEVDDIRIRGTKHATARTVEQAKEKLKGVRVIAAADPSDPSVFTVHLESAALLGNGSIGGSFDIQVPVACAADIQTRNGRIAVRELEGETILETSNAAVAVEDVAGSVQARTSNGRITARDVTGGLTADTGNGVIVAERIGGDCRLGTSNGGIRADGVLGSLRARTSNGHIRADAAPPPGGTVELRTSNGSIDLTLPVDLEAELDLSTSNGVVRMSLEDVPLRVQLLSQNRVKAKMYEGGGPKIAATTSNGVITIKSRSPR
jgi:DUF4097 and DUF4098 domain-containing protein YvlB